ncbi:transposase [Bradyrhizobium sp. UFLA 03-164]|uniref:Transposase n=1 Tax=Bradyrhizobium uaiense TaxID=2594946 RepID=A0A6P1BFC3_9BRAD|nr:transposase [Bradyrhizobium uaiense]
MLLKLYIYGYLNRVQSGRRLEREAGRNVDVTDVAAGSARSAVQYAG